MRLRFHTGSAKSGAAFARLAGLILGVCLQTLCTGGAQADGQGILPAMGAPFAIGDFDGDQLPDLASVQVAHIRNSETEYGIRFELSSGSRLSIDIMAPAGGLQLASRDVNGDSFLDVVVTTALLHRPVAVLLNDGHGNFALKDPAAFPETIRTAESFWTANAQQIREAALTLPPRPSNGDSGEETRLSSRRAVRGAPELVVCRAPGSPVASSILGRAPPTVIHHV